MIVMHKNGCGCESIRAEVYEDEPDTDRVGACKCRPVSQAVRNGDDR
jgi:hypothetical protein